MPPPELACSGGAASYSIGMVWCFPTVTGSIGSYLQWCIGNHFAVLLPSHWFHFPWPELWSGMSWSGIDISVKELVPIVVAAALCCSRWRHSYVCFHSDNIVVVAMLKKRSAKRKWPSFSALPLVLYCVFSVRLCSRTFMILAYSTQQQMHYPVITFLFSHLSFTREPRSRFQPLSWTCLSHSTQTGAPCTGYHYSWVLCPDNSRFLYILFYLQPLFRVLHKVQHPAPSIGTGQCDSFCCLPSTIRCGISVHPRLS